jgi:hypothetical protein
MMTATSAETTALAGGCRVVSSVPRRIELSRLINR